MQILLVDDSQADAVLLTEFLAEVKNAPEVHWVIDGREAIDYVQHTGKYSDAERPDVILLDLSMPRLGGFEALKVLKAMPHCTIPVIVLTTSYNPVDHRKCISLGASGFYSKPSSLQGYEDLVEQLMATDFSGLVRSA